MLQSIIENPNQLIGNNGVIYDITKSNKIHGYQTSLGLHVPKEVIRRKLDTLLYSTCQQIKNLIFK